jgi:hypothetical protein
MPLKGTKGTTSLRVVSHHPGRRALAVAAVVLICAGGALGAYQLGRATAELDEIQLASMERLYAASRLTIEELEAKVIESNLFRDVQAEAAQTLKQDIRVLKDEVAALTEEVTFYKSLMAPSSLAKGLQIADFELTALEEPGRYRFHLLLTQVESRRDWVQGEADLEVEGRMASDEPAGTDGSDSATVNGPKVLPLTEIGEGDSYPLKYRFRYFQDLSGVISLPRGFEPERIVVRAGKRGASTQPLSRTFDWTVAG